VRRGGQRGWEGGGGGENMLFVTNDKTEFISLTFRTY